MHGLAEDQMPKIERSIDYTFEAYSGLEDLENDANEGHCDKLVSENAADCANSSDDVDDTSTIIISQRFIF